MYRTAFHCAAALALLTAIAPASAAGKNNLSQAQSDLRQERSRCLRGESGQERATCLKEAGAALQEARRGRLDNAGNNFTRNATQRCEAQPVEDREACMQRILGAGTAQGSVEGGGLLRQTETLVK